MLSCGGVAVLTMCGLGGAGMGRMRGVDGTVCVVVQFWRITAESLAKLFIGDLAAYCVLFDFD